VPSVIILLISLLIGVDASAQIKDWKQIEVHYRNAQAALRAGHDEIATAEFQEILRLDPSSAPAHANLGVIAFTHKDYSRAASEFEEALKLQPDLWNAKAFLGMTDLRLQHRREARALLAESLTHLQDANLRHNVGNDLISLYFEAGDLDKVVDVIRVLQQTKGTSPDVLYAAYRTYSGLAAKALSSLAEAAPQSPQMHQILAQSLANQDSFPKAIEEYRRAIQLDPGIPGLHYELGEMILASSNTESARGEAEQEFHQELALNPTNASSEFLLGEIEWQRSKPDAALKHDLRALQLREGYVDAQIAAGKALTALGRAQEALGYLQAAATLDPQSEAAHYRLARAYQRLGRTDESEKETAVFKRLREAHQPVRELYQDVLRQPGTDQTRDP
jgi:tetratricopeptide (TPR) repeat protein